MKNSQLLFALPDYQQAFLKKRAKKSKSTTTFELLNIVDAAMKKARAHERLKLKAKKASK